jgi:hypothetical protein
MSKTSIQVKQVRDLAEQHLKGEDLSDILDNGGPSSVGKQGTHISKIDVAKQYGGRYTNMPK